jgi:hypothetical protein
MYEFISTDEFLIKGRGKVFVLSGDQRPKDIFARRLLGQRVIVDGNEWVCAGIEQFCVPDDHPANLKVFGMLVKEVEEEK